MTVETLISESDIFARFRLSFLGIKTWMVVPNCLLLFLSRRIREIKKFQSQPSKILLFSLFFSCGFIIITNLTLDKL